MDYENSDKNLSDGIECQSCTFERAVCLQERQCLIELQKEYVKERKD